MCHPFIIFKDDNPKNKTASKYLVACNKEDVWKFNFKVLLNCYYNLNINGITYDKNNGFILIIHMYYVVKDK